MRNSRTYVFGILCLVLVGLGLYLRLGWATLTGSGSPPGTDGPVNRRDSAVQAPPADGGAGQPGHPALAAAMRTGPSGNRPAEEGRGAGQEDQTSPGFSPAPPRNVSTFGVTAADQSDAVQAAADRIRLQMEARYGALARQLGLTPAQADQFMELLVDKRMAASDATAANLRQVGAVADPAAFADLVAASKDAIEAQIHALLGDAGYAQYLQWQTVTGQAMTVARLQGTLAGSEPLSDAQLAKLQQLFAGNNTGHVTLGVIAGAQAQGFLSPAQLAALQELYLEQQTAQQRRRGAQPAPPGAK